MTTRITFREQDLPIAQLAHPVVLVHDTRNDRIEVMIDPKFHGLDLGEQIACLNLLFATASPHPPGRRLRVVA